MSKETATMRRIAERTIGKPAGSFAVTNNDATTQAIVRNVLDGYRASKDQLQLFARALVKYDRELPILSNIWDFVRNEIEYKLDPSEWQLIKTPEATWHSGFADCKSKSIFIAALLNAFGVPFDFRFTSYSDSATYTHVYIIAHFGNDITIPIDSVFPQFGEEKQYTYKKDYPMKIAQIGALPEKRIPTHGGKLSQPGSGKLTHKFAPDNVDIFKLTEGELTARLHLQRLKIKQAHAVAVKGVGSINAESIQDQIDIAEDVINNLHSDKSLEIIADHVAEGKYNVAHSIQGIGAARQAEVRRARQAERKADKDNRLATNKTTGASNPGGKPSGVRKIVAIVKKAGGVAIKVATAGPRLIIKGVLEEMLPKSAMNFLYLFVNDSALIAKLPESARRKRKKQEEIFMFITKGIGMKSDHVMQILRNGILERTGKEPEQLIAAQVGGQIAGIGIIDDAFEILMKLIKKIAELIKKPAPKFEKADAPDVAADFPAAGSNEAKVLSQAIEAQKPDQFDTAEGTASESSNEQSGKSGARTARKGIC